MSFNLLRRWSPEYALNEAYADVKEEGMRGLNTGKKERSFDPVLLFCCADNIPYYQKINT